MGGIGKNLKRKAEAFSMRIVYHNRNRLSEEVAGGAKYVSFEELLSTSDVLSINLPLNVSHNTHQNTRTVVTLIPNPAKLEPRQRQIRSTVLASCECIHEN